MNGRSEALVLVDEGTTTISTALVASREGRWRLAAAASLPSSVGLEAAMAALARHVAEAGGLAGLTPPVSVPDLPRLHARSTPPPQLVVLAASARNRDRLAEAGRRAGWRIHATDLGSADALATIVALTRRDVTAILVGADDPPGADERGQVGELAAIAAAAVARRPELITIHAGSMGDLASSASVGLGMGPDETTSILAPMPAAPGAAEDPLVGLLDEVRAEPGDGRQAVVRALDDLARVLDRHILLVDVGASAGQIARADPTGAGGPSRHRSATLAGGALVPLDLDDEVVDGVALWASDTGDRYRLRDRLVGLREDPHGGGTGEGATLRLAAARAAVARLAAAVPWTWQPRGPDLVLASGGAWSVAPGPAVALALADVLRHDGARVLGLDAARLLGPLGMVEEDAERAALIADLVDDIVVPLGSVVMPTVAAGRRARGEVTVRVAGAESTLPLVFGGLELFDLPPGQEAEAVLSFADTVVLGSRGRRFAVDVAGGLGGLLVDLRGVPLTLPDNPDQRRARVDAWQRAMWAGIDG
jgi:hypothetical protein